MVRLSSKSSKLDLAMGCHGWLWEGNRENDAVASNTVDMSALQLKNIAKLAR